MTLFPTKSLCLFWPQTEEGYDYVRFVSGGLLGCEDALYSLEHPSFSASGTVDSGTKHYSTHSLLTVAFTTDIEVRSRGFHLRVKAIPNTVWNGKTYSVRNHGKNVGCVLSNSIKSS